MDKRLQRKCVLKIMLEICLIVSLYLQAVVTSVPRVHSTGIMNVDRQNCALIS